MKKFIASILVILTITTFLTGCRFFEDLETAYFWFDYAMEASQGLRDAIENGN